MSIDISASVVTRKKDYATFRRMLDEDTMDQCEFIRNKRKSKTYGKINEETRELLKEYIEVTPFETIMTSRSHRSAVRKLTSYTTSGFLCNWCLTEECHHRRHFHTLRNIEGDLEKQTLHTCPTYERKKEQALL